MNNLVCPECGSEDFEQRRTAGIEYTMHYDARYGWDEIAHTVEDGGDIGDSDIVCADCGTEAIEQDLVTDDVYSDGEDT